VTDEAWARGLAELSTLPRQDSGPGIAELQGRIYREELRHLSDPEWYFAVREAIRRERWFPPCSALLEYAAEYGPDIKLLPPARTEEQRAADREEAKRGLEAIRAHCPWLTATPGRDM
jgi:hypothetical protein